MNSVSCILLLVERGPLVHGGLNKALLLARHVGARLELLLWEPRRGQLAEAEHYLRALRQTVVTNDVPIGAQSCDGVSLAEGVLAALRATPAQLLVRACPPTGQLTHAQDWQLLAATDLPLLLSRGRPWRAQPRFATAIDLGGPADRVVDAKLVTMSELLVRKCAAELDYLFADGHPGVGSSEAHRRMVTLLGPGSAGVGRLQYCVGSARESLPRLIEQRDYDLLLLGVATGRQPAEAAALPAAPLLQAVSGDVLLVPCTQPTA